MRRWTLVTAIAAALAAVGCSAESSPWVRPRRQAEPTGGAARSLQQSRPIRVEYGGCATVRLGEGDELQCIYKPGAQLRLWVMHEEGRAPGFGMKGEGAWSMGEPYVLPEELGQGYRIDLAEAGLGAVTVQLPQRPVWRLALRSVTELSPEDKRALAEPRRRFVELEKTLAPEQGGVSDLSVMPEVRALLGEMVERGQLWGAITRGAAAAYQLTWRAGRPDLAQGLLEDLREQLEKRLPSLEERFPLGASQLSAYLGHALRRRGQLAKAAREYRRATRLVRRTDDPSMVLDVMAPYALVLAELGYFEAAAYWSAEARELAIQHARPYDLAQILTMVAKVSLRLREARQIYEDPAPRLDRVEQIYGHGGPLAKYAEPLDAIMSRAEFALLDGKPKHAMAQIERPRAQEQAPDKLARIEALWLQSLLQLDSEPRLLRESLARLHTLAVDAVGPEVRWKASVLTAQVHQAIGEPKDALEAYLHAEDLLDQLLPLAALGLPGDFTAARHNEGTNRLISLLIDRGEPERAICIVRRARARTGQMALLHRRLDDSAREALAGSIARYSQALLEYESLVDDAGALARPEYESSRVRVTQLQRDLEEQMFQMLSATGTFRASVDCEELNPRTPGELLLFLHPEGSDLRIFVEDDEGVSGYPSLSGYFDRWPDNDWNSDLLLHPLRRRIGRARRIRVLATGAATSIPVHALPWALDAHDRDDERMPLVASVPVVYGLDLPPSKMTGEVGGRMSSEALVLYDGRADAAASEAAEVASSLEVGGWKVSKRAAHDMSAAELRDTLRRVDFFHYAGHAYYASPATGEAPVGVRDDEGLRRWPPYAGGAASKPSYIPLRDHGKLSVPDVLIMERVPHTVLLMGCSTGVIDERMALGGFSLAAALLGAGAQVVIASTQDVDGREAASLAHALYRGVAQEPDADPGRWMTRAMRTIGTRGQVDVAVANYRIYVP